MAVALREEVTPSAAEIIQELAKARARPDDALRAAVDHAAEIAPTIIALVEKATNGSALDEGECNLLFWGIHALGAARRKELCRPLMRLVRECPPDELESLLGDAGIETLAKITVSVFDGDAAPLVDACADRRVAGYIRWNLIGALARLTFDGAVAREITLAFLDRFDREPLAEPEDEAWQGWQDAICLLGLDEMRERLVAANREDRFLQSDDELEAALKDLALARNLTPGDPGLFVREHYVPIEDPVKDLGWVSDENDSASDDDEEMDDPAGSFALKQDEIDGLAQFLQSEHLPDDAMTVEEIDGFFCALAMDSNLARASEYLWAILGSTDDNSPFESDEQQSRVADLVNRMWNTIVERFDAGHVHEPVLQESSAPTGQLWAKGFMTGMQPTQALWTERLQNDDDILTFFDPILKLALDDDEELEGFTMTAEEREESISVLPPSLLALFEAVRLREQQRLAQPARSTKIGRNEPCPCGSGKKYKKCCGSAEKRDLQ